MRLGMESARDMRHRFEDFTPERAAAITHATRDTIATFTDASILPSEVLSVSVPGRGSTVAGVLWDPCLETAVIGQTMMMRLCPSPPV